jgi:hypothetical protein
MRDDLHLHAERKVKGPNSNAGFSPPKFLELLPELQ